MLLQRSKGTVVCLWSLMYILLLQHGLTDALVTPANRTLCADPQSSPANRVNTTERLAHLREQMSTKGVQAYLVPYEDQHISDPAEHDEKLKYISGFSGSNGYAWVTATSAAMWTDGRYFLQADQQMDCNWILMKMSVPGYPLASQWLAEVLNTTDKASANPNLVSIATWKQYEDDLGAQNISFGNFTEDLIDTTWTDRPPRPNNPVYVHNLSYAGVTWQDKVKDVRNQLDSGTILFTTALDDTAWLFNLRGSDRDTSPLYYSSALITTTEAVLYLENITKLLTAEIIAHLNTSASGQCTMQPCVIVKEYRVALTDLSAHAQNSTTNTVWISSKSNYATYISAGEKRMLQDSPIQLMKAIKNSVEIVKYYECQVRDSAALSEALATLTTQMEQGATVYELDVVDLLLQTRRKDTNFKMHSFDSIVGFGANGAVIHYRPTNETNTLITTKGLVLIDSGGNYLDGTTDVTRTLHFGEPSDTEKLAYTRVLMGHIDLALGVWPQGKNGRILDTLARVPIWQNGWDYNHGTGHGIGYFLNVHESPSGISDSPLLAGMFLSDEPGFYEDGKFGVRLETIVGVEVKNLTNRFNDVNYLGFKAATLVPYEQKLIKMEMMTNDQIAWLNKYHQRCQNETGEYLKRTNRIEAYNWLMEKSSPISLTPSASGSAVSAFHMLWWTYIMRFLTLIIVLFVTKP